MFFSMFCCLCFFEGAALAHPTIVSLKLFCLPYIGQRRMLIDIYTCWFSGGLLTYNRFIQGGLLKCWSHSSSFLFPFFFRSRYIRPLFRCFNIPYVQPSTGMSFFKMVFSIKNAGGFASRSTTIGQEPGKSTFSASVAIVFSLER